MWIQPGRAIRISSEQSCCQHNGHCFAINEATVMWNIHILSDLAYYQSPGGEYKVVVPPPLRLNWKDVCHYHELSMGSAWVFYPPCIYQLQKVMIAISILAY